MRKHELSSKVEKTTTITTPKTHLPSPKFVMDVVQKGSHNNQLVRKKIRVRLIL